MADAYAICNVVPFCPVSADLFMFCGFVYCFCFLPRKTISRGEFKNASAFKRSLYWCQALHITNKDRYQSTSARRALALLNSALV